MYLSVVKKSENTSVIKNKPKNLVNVANYEKNSKKFLSIAILRARDYNIA